MLLENSLNLIWIVSTGISTKTTASFPLKSMADCRWEGMTKNTTFYNRILQMRMWLKVTVNKRRQAINAAKW